MKVKIKSVPRKTAKNGAFLERLSSDMQMAHGPSHSNGGIPYKQGVEIEGGEPIYTHPTGEETVFGNMLIPGTKMKFKQAAQNLAKKDQKVDKLVENASNLVNSYDWTDKWDELKYNAGKAMLDGGIMKKQELKQNKEHLANLQQALLETADEMGADPFNLSKGSIVKAKNGVTLKYTNGGDPDPKKSMAVRMNNPGNIKFGAFAKKYGAVQGDPAKDGGYFAKFPDSNTGMKALQGLLKTNGYKNLSVDAAIKRWTNGSGYSVDYHDIKNKTVGQLSDKDFGRLVDVITMGEDGKYYTPPSTSKVNTPSGKPYIPEYITPTLKDITPGPQKNTYSPRTVTGDDTPIKVTPYNTPNLPSNAKELDWYQIAPELAAFAQNRVEPVHMQQYDPQLYQPTTYSFQDRLNENNTSFNSLKRILAKDPTALASLAGQKYGQDNSIMGDEFRTNQQIEQDITNKNISLLNDAQLKNLSLADTQYVRQEQAKSNTKAVNNTILNSITGKLAQNEARNQALRYYETLSQFRFDPNSGTVRYMGPNMAGDLTTNGGNSNQTDNNTSVKQTLNPDGSVKSTSYSTPSIIKQQEDAMRSQMMLQKFKDMQVSNISNRPKTRFKDGGNIAKFFNSNKK